MKMTWIVGDNEHYYPDISVFDDEQSAREWFEVRKLMADGSSNSGIYLAYVVDMYKPPRKGEK